MTGVIHVEAVVTVELLDPGTEPERRDELMLDLRQELTELDVTSVSTVPAGQAPPGSKGFDNAAAAALLVQVQGSASALSMLVSAVRLWLGRGKQPGRSVRLTIGDRTLELSHATSEQQDRLMEEFLRAAPEA